MEGRPYPTKLVYGGRLRDELVKNNTIRRQLKLLDQVGRAKTVSQELIEVEIKAIKAQTDCKSDDIHILALARAAKVSVLCTNDSKLIADFKDKKILPEPRGRVFSKAGHRHLLRDSCP